MMTEVKRRRWPRRITWMLGILALLLVSAFVALRTPDTDRAGMIARYGGPQSQFITLPDGASVHVRDTGGALPVMVLLHGSNASLHTWQPLIDRLRGDYRIVTLDLPGHGLTGATPTGRYDIPEMVAAVDGIANSLNLPRFILGGNSMGGGVSWRYALAHPDRVSALILLDAGGMPPRADDPPPAGNIGFTIMRTSVGRWLGTRISPRNLYERSLRQSVSNQAIITPTVVNRYWELNRFPGNRAATGIRFARGSDASGAEQARRITAPTLILFGAEDRLINPSAAHSFHERIAGSQVVLLPGVGHLPMEEAPDQTAAAIRAFMAR